VRALIATALGVLVVDLESEEVLEDEVADELPPSPDVELPLPRVVAAARHGSTVIAVVDRRPPVVVSHDAGITWRETGAGLPPGRAVAIAPHDPDVVLFAGAERLYLSHDGGRFWEALALELPDITAVCFEDR
jgi:hypothetical protein